MSRLRDDVFVEQLPRPDYLVHGVLVQGSLAAIYGPPGSYKTFVAVDLGFSVASGSDWHKRHVSTGPVVHVYAEGTGGLGPRVRAWKSKHNKTGRVGVHFLPEPVSLLDTPDVHRFADELAQLEAKPRLVVLDTLARCFTGGDENSTADMSRAIAAADRLRTATGATVLIVHHSGTRADRERGSSALRGAVDTLIHADRDSDNGVTLRCDKQKDAQPFAPIRLQFSPEGDSGVLV